MEPSFTMLCSRIPRLPRGLVSESQRTRIDSATAGEQTSGMSAMSASIESVVIKQNHLAVLLLKSGAITAVNQITKRGVNCVMGDDSRISRTAPDCIPGAFHP